MKHTYNWLAKKKQMITQYILNMQHDARLVHIAFLMDKVVLGQIFYSSKYCSFPSQFLKRCTSGTYLIVRFLRHTIVCTYSIYKEAPEDGPLRSETCRADTWASINNQCCYTVYLVGMYIYCKKWYTDLPMSRITTFSLYTIRYYMQNQITCKASCICTHTALSMIKQSKVAYD